jgi:ABC-type uncharacterized transport system involved in gliding motility auxiliary subunit
MAPRKPRKSEDFDKLFPNDLLKVASSITSHPSSTDPSPSSITSHPSSTNPSPSSITSHPSSTDPSPSSTIEKTETNVVGNSRFFELFRRIIS